jgi:hypothetical protein
MLPDFDLKNIRLHNGSQHNAFEELCCQLASLEPRALGSDFYRKGLGADAGVECFVRCANKDEIGWQVKYYSGMGKALISSLDESFKTAFAKHPKLTKYVVCLPFDLSDSRITRKKTPQQQWDDWKEKWQGWSRDRGRNLIFELWSAHHIKERLSRNDSNYAGRLLFWFDREALTGKWFREKFDRARADLGRRYTPETNVELPIRKSLLALARSPQLAESIERWLEVINEAGYRAARAVEELAACAGASPPPEGLIGAVTAILSSLEGASLDPSTLIPTNSWIERIIAAQAIGRSCLNWAWSQEVRETKSGRDSSNWARSSLFEFQDKLSSILDELESDSWKLVNAHNVLVVGDAGCGKSHLLADATEYQLMRERPAVLLLGQKFNDSDPWAQILRELDLPIHYQVKQFLGALDAAAQATGCRAVIAIDALNERKGVDVWPHRLASFLCDLEPFPRIVAILSCRTSFLESVIPSQLSAELLPRTTHRGFSANAARYYLDVRGFVLPAVPYPMPEFGNPLFLKTMCDALEKQGLREFPRGLQGLTSTFDFYFSAVTQNLNHRLRLTPNRRIIETALDALTLGFTDSRTGYMSVNDAQKLVDAIYPTKGNVEDDLLFQLEAEGVLSIEMLEFDHAKSQQVRFTFQRYSDHAIATRVLNEHLDKANPERSFRPGTVLHRIVAGEDAYRDAGIIEAIAIQLPERIGKEILELVSSFTEGSPGWLLEQAFRESLLWRDQRFFSESTLSTAKRIGGVDLTRRVLLTIATEPKNPFNAYYLHGVLLARPMPRRDASWSISVAMYDNENDPIETLISWANSQGLSEIEDSRAELGAIVLAWLCSSSNRFERDRATKGLVSILAPRLSVAVRLLDRFKSVDDLYVLERILVAIYGAAMQGISKIDDLAAVALKTYDLLFASGRPPENILLRDAGRGIVEYAIYRGCNLEQVDVPKIRPPYWSKWPIDYVSDETIESFKEEYEGGHVLTDSIVSSAVNDGDFARYIIDPHVAEWSPARIGTARLPTQQDLYKEWQNRFDAVATAEMKSALEGVKLASVQAKLDHFATNVPSMKALDEAEDRLRRSMQPDLWEDYRVTAQSEVRYGGRGGEISRWPAHFDRGWARRWICKRAHELGWSSELHGEFDRSLYRSYSRNNHQIERIGKKYQWLALYELRAKLADNLVFIASRHDATEQTYEGEWHHGLRNIDPSLLITKTNDDGWEDWREATWWMPRLSHLQPISPEERLAWLESPRDILDSSDLIAVRDPRTNRKWLTLFSSYGKRQWKTANGHRGLERDVWCRIACYLVRQPDEQRLLEALKDRRLTDPSIVSRYEFSRGEAHLGEFPWHPAFGGIDDWISDDWNKIPVKVLPTTSQYTCGAGSYDYSVDQVMHIQLPSRWLATALNLRLSNGRSIEFVDHEGIVRFFDPSLTLQGPSAGLIDEEIFDTLLTRHELSAIWIIAGEKGAYGGHWSSTNFGGRYAFSSVYARRGAVFVKHTHEEYDRPTFDQLEEFLGRTPPKTAKVRAEKGR